jgi:hypothetical protein
MYSDAGFVVSLLRMAERYPYCFGNEDLAIRNSVIDKMMDMIDYSTNYLKVNYDAVLKPMSAVKAIRNEAVTTYDEDLHDYRRIAFLALSQAIEFKKEMDWLCEQYKMPVAADSSLIAINEGDGSLNRESIKGEMKALELVRKENEILHNRINELGEQLNSLLNSQSWRITAPLRMMKKGIPSNT